MANQQFSKAKSISIKHAFSEKGYIIMAAIAYLAFLLLPAFSSSKNSFASEAEAVSSQNQQDPQTQVDITLDTQSPVLGSDTTVPSEASESVKTDSSSSSVISINSAVTTSGGSTSQSVVTTETVNGVTEQTVVKSENDSNSTVKFNVNVDPNSDTDMKVTERNGRVKVDYRSRSE